MPGLCKTVFGQSVETCARDEADQRDRIFDIGKGLGVELTLNQLIWRAMKLESVMIYEPIQFRCGQFLCFCYVILLVLRNRERHKNG